jgi:hypothetical protein
VPIIVAELGPHPGLTVLLIAPGQSRAWENIDASDQRALVAGLEQVLNTFSDRTSFQRQNRQ